MEPGTRVEVRSRFEQAWSRGFDVAEIIWDAEHNGEPRFRLRRRSDSSILPTLFDADDVREEKRKSMWWH